MFVQFVERKIQTGVLHCKKKFLVFPVPSRDVTNQTPPGRELLNYSQPGKVWLVTSRLHRKKSFSIFLSPCSVTYQTLPGRD
jgi:hypothetical protein